MDKFLQAYIKCALWAETDNSNDQGGDPLDKNYNESDLSTECLAQFMHDCQNFQEENFADLKGMDSGQAGHDFWLTRNGHGAGFWDRGLGEKGKRLSKASKVYGSVDLYVNDGKVCCN